MYYTADNCDWTVTLDKPIPDLEFSKAQPIYKYLYRSGIHPKLDFQINRFRWNQWNKKEIDIYHPTYYDWVSCHEPQRLKKPIVCTVHDCIHERYPEHQEKDPFTVSAKKRIIERADKIICISENTAADIDYYYPGHSDKITVTLSGTDRAPPSDMKNPTLDYFAYVGAREGYKNFESTLKALKICQDEGNSFNLKVAGSQPTESELELIASLNLDQHIEWLGFLEDEDLAAFYYHSVALLYPSLYEGFGLPALDAMACGSTVIAHNASSLPEVVGKGGLLVDATQPQELAEAMTALTDSKLREPLLKEAQQQTQKLHWRQCADAMVREYQKLI